MTDETNEPADSAKPNAEPEPGTTEWLLAQLSGGRIDSRRERREAEAALEAAGVPIPDATSEHPVADEPAPVETPEERPRARFSWETGTLEAVGGAGAQPETPAEDANAAPEERREEPSPEPEPEPEPEPAPEPDPADFIVATAEPRQADSPVIPFMWNLSPTDEPDPALNPPVEIPEPAFNEPDFPFPSAAPIVVPKPAARASMTDASADDAASEDAAPTPLPEEPAEATPAPLAAEPAEAAPSPLAEEQRETPRLEEAPEPEPELAPGPVLSEPEPALPVPPPPPAHAPLPPGTTAHEFDPFAQDLFAPTEAITPVPSVDEFTIPDEDSPAQPAEEAQPEQHVSSDWDDIADMLGAHPETVDNAIVSPMPPVNEILPSFDALLPRSATQTPDDPASTEQAEAGPSAAAVAPPAAAVAPPAPATPAAAEPAAPGNDIVPAPAAAVFAAPAHPVVPTATSAFGQPLSQTTPPGQPPVAPIEHARGGSSLNRWLLIAAAILLAILIGIGLFALGRAVAAGHDQTPVASTRTATPKASPTQTPTPTPTPTQTQAQALAGSGPLAPGHSYQWDQLRGGECINPFSSAWAQQFAVVDCNAQHAAQLVYTAPFATDPAAPFPGAQAISSQIGLLCSKPGVVDLHAAAAYSDVQVVAAYPVNADQWTSGQRSYFCFVTRSSGQQFSSSIKGPGPSK